MQVLRTFARVYSTDLDATLSLYRTARFDERDERRFTLPEAGVEVRITGGTVVVAGSDEALAAFRATDTTWVGDDLDGAMRELAPRTDSVVRPPADVPTGRNATICTGGVQIELVQWDAPVTSDASDPPPTS